MSAFQFGDRVLVLARTVPVVASTDGNGGLVFRQAIPPRDHGRVVTEDLEGFDTWPGEPLPPAWVPAPESFQLEPERAQGEAYRRLRRLVATVPTVGVVVGQTYKQEGTLREGIRTADLGGPGRRIELYEVAVPSRSRAKLVLAHARDLQAVVQVNAERT